MTRSDSQLTPDAPRCSRLGIVAFAMILVIAIIALPKAGIASETRAGAEVDIGADETVDDDLYVSAGEVSIQGDVTRDAFIAAGDVDLSGDIDGAVYIAAGNVEIDGTVGGSVRVLGGNTVISGNIAGDLVLIGGATRIEPSASIDGDLLIHGGRLELQGELGGDISGNVSDATIGGTVDGDVDIQVDMLEVTSQAEIGGSLDYTGFQGADIAPGADIDGGVERARIMPWATGDGLWARFFSPLVRTLWLLVAGAVMIAVAPRLAAAVGENVRRPWIGLVVGLLSLVVLPVLAVALITSVIGLPVGVILLALLAIALYLSQVVVGQWLGAVILPGSWNDGSRGYLLLAMTIGVLIISAFRFVPLPFVSTVVNALVAVVGLGAMVLIVRRLRPVAPGRVA